jgi:hypothetical protein
MVDYDKREQAPEDHPSVAPAPAPKVLAKHRQSLSKSRRELTEEELAQSGVRLMLLDEVDRLESEVSDLTKFRDQFHAADKRLATLEAERKRHHALEILYGACLSLGVGMLMLAPTLPAGAIRSTTIAVGAILVACGISAKVVQR